MKVETFLAQDTAIKLKWPRISFTAEVYGLGEWIRKYGFYPSFLPICVSTDHGPSQRDEPTRSEFAHEFPVIFYHSNRLVEQWKSKSSRPAFNLMSPFVFYRHYNKIEQDKCANGTIVFPAHSTELVDVEQDLKAFIAKLKTLPEAMQPVSVCMYYLDVLKGRHTLFLNSGIDVYTAGHIYDEKFVENFYSIIKKFKHSASNHVGSYAFYCEEMGLDFHLIGERPSMTNLGEPNCPPGTYDVSITSSQICASERIFSEAKSREEVRDFIQQELGLVNPIGRFKMAAILYMSLLSFPYLCTVKALRKVAKRFLSKRPISVFGKSP